MKHETLSPVTVSRKIGRNKGKPRLWLEGDILQSHGFHHGAQWVLLKLETGLFIELVCTDEKRIHGERVRKVSGKAGRPVIDITGASLGKLGELDTVTVKAALGLIKVSA